MRGEDMKNFRILRNWGQDELAEHLNQTLGRKYTRPKISRWETGAERIPADVAAHLSGPAQPPRRKGALVLGFANFKGGVGKTTLSVNVADALARAGHRVLLVDCDPQYNATKLLGLPAAALFEERRTLFHALERDLGIADVVVRGPGFDVATSHIDLMRVETRSEPGAEFILKEKLAPLADRYDFVIIDAPPNPGKLTTMVLAAAHRLVIPVRTEPLDSSGLDLLLEQLSQVQRRLNTGLKVLGVVPNHYDARKAVDQILLGTIRDNLSAKFRVFEPVPYDSAFGKAGLMNQTVVSAWARSSGAKAIMSLVREIENA